MTMKQVAASLGRRGAQGKAGRGKAESGRPRLPHLWFLTDPARTSEPLALASRLPRGAVVVYRPFGAADRLAVAGALRQATRVQGQTLLIGADWRLAAMVGADGVHLPQRLMRLSLDLRRRHPRWLISAAAHDAAAVIAAGRGPLDAILVSAVFPSQSPSAGPPLGPVRFAALVRRSRVPVIALGGVNDKTARRLLSSPAHGLAGVGFVRS